MLGGPTRFISGRDISRFWSRPVQKIFANFTFLGNAAFSSPIKSRA
jgi:hypothetical protein